MSGRARNPERRCKICGAKCEKRMRYCKLCAREVKEIRERREGLIAPPLSTGSHLGDLLPVAKGGAKS